MTIRPTEGEHRVTYATPVQTANIITAVFFIGRGIEVTNNPVFYAIHRIFPDLRIDASSIPTAAERVRTKTMSLITTGLHPKQISPGFPYAEEDSLERVEFTRNVEKVATDAATNLQAILEGQDTLGENVPLTHYLIDLLGRIIDQDKRFFTETDIPPEVNLRRSALCEYILGFGQEQNALTTVSLEVNHVLAQVKEKVLNRNFPEFRKLFDTNEEPATWIEDIKTVIDIYNKKNAYRVHFVPVEYPLLVKDYLKHKQEDSK